MNPYEQAVARVEDPAWSFDTNPTKAIGDATQKATEHSLHGRPSRAKYWTRVGIQLSAFAGTEPGAVIHELADRYDISLTPVGS